MAEADTYHGVGRSGERRMVADVAAVPAIAARGLRAAAPRRR